MIVIGWGYAARKEKLVLDALSQAQHKNTYLEHAAKILRHDMHSGINTYIPRGVRSLERRLERDPEIIERLKLDAPLRMLKEGLAHTRRVYQGVTEFTNLVRDGVEIQKTESDLKALMVDYLDMTSYKDHLDGIALSDPWHFEVDIHLVDAGSLDQIYMILPDGFTSYPLDNEGDNWGYGSWPTSYPTLTALQAIYPTGLYTFDFRDGSDMLIKSVQMDHCRQ